MLMEDGGKTNMADILTEVMHFYSMGGLTSYWRIRGNE